MRRFHPTKHSGWTRWAIAWTATAIALLWVTGVMLYVWPSADIAELDPARVELRRWAVAIHGSVVWFAFYLAGRWVSPHIGSTWRRPRTPTWFVGLATLALIALVAVTGLALLYGPGALHDWIAGAHWWLAVAIPVIAVWHAKGLMQRRAVRRGTHRTREHID